MTNEDIEYALEHMRKDTVEGIYLYQVVLELKSSRAKIAVYEKYLITVHKMLEEFISEKITFEDRQ